MTPRSEQLQMLRRYVARVVPQPLHGIARTVKAALLPRRRFHAFGLGAPRSGTLALTHMFKVRYRAMHEAEFRATLRLTSGHSDALLRALKLRDWRMRHELEVSCLLNELTEPLQLAFPQARYILLIRDCYSWLDSIINLSLRIDGPGLAEWLPHLLRPGCFSFQRHDQALKEAGLFPLDAYLSYWARVNQHVLETVPQSKLLVLRSRELVDGRGALADHLGVEMETIDRTPYRPSSFVKYGLVERLDRSYLVESCERHCGPLMQQFYPHLSFDDVQLERSDTTDLELDRLAKQLGRALA